MKNRSLMLSTVFMALALTTASSHAQELQLVQVSLTEGTQGLLSRTLTSFTVAAGRDVVFCDLEGPLFQSPKNGRCALSLQPSHIDGIISLNFPDDNHVRVYYQETATRVLLKEYPEVVAQAFGPYTLYLQRVNDRNAQRPAAAHLHP